MKRSISLLLITITVLSGCAFTDFLKSAKNKFIDSKLPTQEIVLETDNEKIQLNVEIADSTEERAKGLMEREKLPDGQGMLFVFTEEGQRVFWMKNTLIPLDLVFFNKDKEIVSVVQEMEPCKTAECPRYESGAPAMYALELPAGFVAKHKIALGDKLIND